MSGGIGDRPTRLGVSMLQSWPARISQAPWRRSRKKTRMRSVLLLLLTATLGGIAEEIGFDVAGDLSAVALAADLERHAGILQALAQLGKFARDGVAVGDLGEVRADPAADVGGAVDGGEIEEPAWGEIEC